MFSGAFIAGSVEQLSQIARATSTLYSATTVCINYRLAPEHAFPTAVHDAIDSVIWVSEHATEPLLNSNPALGFVLGGASSGGNLAAVLSRYFQAAERRLKYPITGQWRGVANLMTPDSVPAEYVPYFQSLTQNANAPILNAQALASGSLALRDDPASELRFPVNSKTRVEEQPRTYIQVCGMDPLRDDGLIYDEMLRVAGVQTRAVTDIVVGLGWLLGKEVTREEVEKVL
ncbi:Alpha/beta hydrolase fold-3 [Phaeosphaeriaceae sp. SRC1lsM3a]|nr:Alpha/beta hydrolase fold-3 [Stagonospora sp. SRC1lsM3a]